ncbi:MAG: hypothetical protein US83_C0004G0048 [Candidatus Falkowbacteria bacterium GW2011_GWC2_38_22]|uniref:Isochorismatase-like domain-containing protein n=1 Tax=Candidatus Falkowbacteria bacterium GW2011_GWE1_38_31 TaxID=1618638 RepID=A0A0G0MA67_9BACT|nr:MAG: hypothetical protein US73_C0002G0069 [Candidatus Falkowbacteria bacterium GW2011_GWF2_38_1205]KKQ61664.1 MAG: hypothetical protein US83_C0004G0048 [Candidatus Falkowbacteria bacterium GW2011_GWC2_38_22]KKQ63721.1 MAG: hypothetical protein US84_C0004G0069 [Candidatus Falkowbacteria bacterium GW2011_GWF1_38_22]KKQ65863.1 MAG: hypothetical protein US87_C0004G0048 [Candidatus Falkowbacteria bacterium GW2011_GWE2_38_254]KKQ70584.1 MAG: hypothetical protein US91_C0004G0069 [Candidatus Falkowb
MAIFHIGAYETDVQGCFSFRNGELFVYGQKVKKPGYYGAEAVLPIICSIHEFAQANGWSIFGSVDRHFYEDAELIRNKGGSFIDHAMNGTKGQLRLDFLEPQKDIYIKSKEGPLLGTRIYTMAEIQMFINSGMQLIFEKQTYDVATNPNFEMAFKMFVEQGLRIMIVYGFATDYCVLAAVLAMLAIKKKYNLDFDVYVVTDAIEEVNIDFEGNVDMGFGIKALARMAKAGAKFTTSEDVFSFKY